MHWVCCESLNYEELWSVIRNVKFSSREGAVVSIVNDIFGGVVIAIDHYL